MALTERWMALSFFRQRFSKHQDVPGGRMTLGRPASVFIRLRHTACRCYRWDDGDGAVASAHRAKSGRVREEVAASVEEVRRRWMVSRLREDSKKQAWKRFRGSARIRSALAHFSTNDPISQTKLNTTIFTLHPRRHIALPRPASAGDTSEEVLLNCSARPQQTHSVSSSAPFASVDSETS